MTGQLQPRLQTQIAVEEGVRGPDISSAFAGFFRTAQGYSQATGPSVSELNSAADRVYGEALKKSLALKAQGKPGQATALAKQATVDYVANGGNPNDAHTTIYEGVTGQTFGMIASTNEEEFSKFDWAGTDDAKMWMAKARNINKTKFNNSLSDAQVMELAWSESESNLSAQARKLQLESDMDAGILVDAAGVSHEVIPLLKNDFAALMGFFDGATADGYASQDEIKQATTMVNEWVVQKYGKFMDQNEEVKVVIGEMRALVDSLGTMDFTGEGASRDFFHEVAQQIDDPLMRGYYELMLKTPEGQKYLIEQTGGLPGAATFGEIVSNLRAPVQPKSVTPNTPSTLGSSAPHISWGDYSMGTPLSERFTGITDGTTAVPMDTPEKNADGKKMIEATAGFINKDMSKTLATDETGQKTFATMAILNAETVAAQTTSVLSKTLLTEFASPKFIKNLNTLFTADEESAVRVATAYNSALSSELNRLQTAMNANQSPRSVSLGLDAEGQVQFDTEMFDEAVAASSDEQFKRNWESIKVLIANEGIEAYLRNDAHLGNRSTDIDSFAGTNLREIMRLIDSARMVVDKQTRINLLMQKNQEAFMLYGDSKIIESGIQGDQAQQEAEAIGQEAVETIGNTISSSPLDSMEQVDAGPRTVAPSPEGVNYGGQENPWPIAWSEERNDDEELFNSLPDGAWFIDPDGVKRKKFRNIPVEGE